MHTGTVVTFEKRAVVPCGALLLCANFPTLHHLELQTPVQWWGASSRRSVAAVCRTAAVVVVLRLCSHDLREASLVPQSDGASCQSVWHNRRSRQR